MESGTYIVLRLEFSLSLVNGHVGKYRLSVLGVGLGNYLTRSVYDIEGRSREKLLYLMIFQNLRRLPGKTSPRDPMDFVAIGRIQSLPNRYNNAMNMLYQCDINYSFASDHYTRKHYTVEN